MISLREVVRREINYLDNHGLESVPAVIQALKEAGAIRGENVGVATLIPEGSDECVKWYAGQILDILESQTWFGVNSLINTLDKFCPQEAPV